MSAPFDVISELAWRGLINQSTDEARLRAHLGSPATSPRRVYCGFDPTADSLTIGNLVPIMALRHFQRAGHQPVVVVGGGTGLIGDPSGKTAERQLLTREKVAEHVRGQLRIFRSLLSFDGANAASISDNGDWLCALSYIDVLRDVGKFFSVNMMVQKDSVRARLERPDQGISYTEFSYMILQAYDYLHLYREKGVSVQIGGADQWGNIVAGIDLIRRTMAAHSDDPEKASREHETHGLTMPLVTKADGGKFGKTESGAVWLTADRTSPFAYYQFWLNTADADISRFLRIFTLLTREQIEALDASAREQPEKREAQRALAREATTLLHGEAAMRNAEAAAAALFSGDLRSLDAPTLNEALAGLATSTHARAELAGDGVALVDLLPMTTLAKSKREAREFLEGGSISLNGEKVGASDRLTASRLLHGSIGALRRGKKAWHVTKWE